MRRFVPPRPLRGRYGTFLIYYIVRSWRIAPFGKIKTVRERRRRRVPDLPYVSERLRLRFSRQQRPKHPTVSSGCGTFELHTALCPLSLHFSSFLLEWIKYSTFKSELSSPFLNFFAIYCGADLNFFNFFLHKSLYFGKNCGMIILNLKRRRSNASMHRSIYLQKGFPL